MVLYFTGTGNSKYVAQRIAEGLGDTLLCMNDRIRAGDTSPVETGRRLVIVTPTYAWRIPRLVRDWLRSTELRGAERIWFVMTCGSEIGSADKYNRALCAEKGLVAAAPPTASRCAAASPSGARAAPTAWPASATAPRRLLNTGKRVSASRGITLRRCENSGCKGLRAVEAGETIPKLRDHKL